MASSEDGGWGHSSILGPVRTHVSAHGGLGRQRATLERRWGLSWDARPMLPERCHHGHWAGAQKGKKHGQWGSQSPRGLGEMTRGVPSSETSTWRPPPVMAGPSLVTAAQPRWSWRLRPGRFPHCRRAFTLSGACALPRQHAYAPLSVCLYFFTASSRLWESDIYTPGWRVWLLP